MSKIDPQLFKGVCNALKSLDGRAVVNHSEPSPGDLERVTKENSRLVAENAALKAELAKHCADPKDPSDHCPLCAQEKQIAALKAEVERLKQPIKDVLLSMREKLQEKNSDLVALDALLNEFDAVTEFEKLKAVAEEMADALERYRQMGDRGFPSYEVAEEALTAYKQWKEKV